MARVDDVAAALVADVGPMSTMKLQKLLYFAQAWSLAVMDRPLFEDPVEAWAQGPVVKKVWAARAGKRTIDQWPEGDVSRLADDERALLHLVRMHYGDLSGDDLSDLTHRHRPWSEAREGLREKEPTDRPVDPGVMKEFYRGRTLVGRTAADLAAGGLFPPTRDHVEDPDRFHDDLAAIRESFRGDPREEPASYPHREAFSRSRRDTPAFATTLPKAARGGDRPQR